MSTTRTRTVAPTTFTIPAEMVRPAEGTREYVSLLQVESAESKIEAERVILKSQGKFGDLCLAIEMITRKGTGVKITHLAADAKLILAAKPHLRGEILTSDSTLGAAKRTGLIMTTGDLPDDVTARDIQALVIKVSKISFDGKTLGLPVVDRVIVKLDGEGPAAIIAELIKVGNDYERAERKRVADAKKAAEGTEGGGSEGGGSEGGAGTGGSNSEAAVTDLELIKKAAELITQAIMIGLTPESVAVLVKIGSAVSAAVAGMPVTDTDEDDATVTADVVSESTTIVAA